MVVLFLSGVGVKTLTVEFEIGQSTTTDDFNSFISNEYSIPMGLFYLSSSSKCLLSGKPLSLYLSSLSTVSINVRGLGGIDFQHREGSKVGSGGQLSEAQASIARRERLRKLALENIDLQKDPYFMRNHVGTFECKLCLTLHTNEGNYLAHTQGKRHQSNLGRRAAMEAKNAAPKPIEAKETIKRDSIKIGKPGYKVTKSRDVQTNQRSLIFEIDYPEASEDTQPRHRFMSAYEQRVDMPPDKNYQYLLFACEPYETVAFKIPNQPVDKRQGAFYTNWDARGKKFVLQLFFIAAPTSYVI